MITTYLHLGPRLRTNGTIPWTSPDVPSRCAEINVTYRRATDIECKESLWRSACQVSSVKDETNALFYSDPDCPTNCDQLVWRKEGSLDKASSSLDCRPINWLVSKILYLSTAILTPIKATVPTFLPNLLFTEHLFANIRTRSPPIREGNLVADDYRNCFKSRTEFI
jgi:hypothetical protein